MKGYLGCNVVDVKDTPYKEYTSIDWAMYFVTVCCGFDGAHHKDWVLDQVVRCLKGTDIVVSVAKWDNGQEEYRIQTADEPSKQYNDWVTSMLGDYDEETDEYEYTYENGCPP